MISSFPLCSISYGTLIFILMLLLFFLLTFLLFSRYVPVVRYLVLHTGCCFLFDALLAQSSVLSFVFPFFSFYLHVYFSFFDFPKFESC